MPNLLNLAHVRLGWPTRQDILRPKGGGPKVLAQIAESKIGAQLRRIPECAGVKVGILAANPSRDATESPLAVVCEFLRPVSDATLRAAQRLCWNFSWSPQLIVVEPHLVRSFTCCKPPHEKAELSSYEVARIHEVELGPTGASLAHQAAKSLHWVHLISGQFFRDSEPLFKRDQRADRRLLSNLRCVKNRLLQETKDQAKLDEDICHYLLARVIFIQFLMDRKDSAGRAALDPNRLCQLSRQGVLSRECTSLEQILESKADTYSFFHYLDGRFNGDLFSGKENYPKSHGLSWRAEMNHVQEGHLRTLSEFIGGRLQMDDGQLCLWKQYAFDVIPLEFISSIYEEFLNEAAKDEAAHYTPGHIVDFMLDAVLPWDGSEWNLRILDPACGSGIFLVKAYQRLIYRWKKAHGGKTPRADVLRRMLMRNLYAVDINPHAVRVASFSLYLAMCEEIDPICLWQRVRFPRLGGRTLVRADFFQEDTHGFKTTEDAKKYDLVIGNVPWGQDQETEAANRWAHENGWPISNKNPGPLFLAKAAALTKDHGRVTMIQPAQSLLTNLQSTAVKFRKQLFERFRVEEVVNLSALRFRLFKDSTSPACLVTLSPRAAHGEPIVYVVPKRSGSQEDDCLIVIEPHDVNYIRPHEAASDSAVWSALMWGGRRDLALARRLSEMPSLGDLADSGRVKTREGVIRGNREKEQSCILGRRILERASFPEGLLFCDAQTLPINTDPQTDGRASTDFEAFDAPQLILKQSWKSGGRFRAFMVIPDNPVKGIICSQSYVSVHVDRSSATVLEGACLAYNSILAVYHLFLTSGRCSGYIPEALVKEILSVPIPPYKEGLLEGISSLEELDARVKQAFGFEDAEWALVEDLARYTIPDFKGGASPGRRRTSRGAPQAQACRTANEPELHQYCDYFRRVLRAGFGQDLKISTTIFRESNDNLLPVRLVAIYLDTPVQDSMACSDIDSGELLDRLSELYAKLMKAERSSPRGIGYQRVARVYDTASIDRRVVPTIYIIKPDQVRYWTRSVALRDADEVVADIMAWQAQDAAKER